MDAQDAYVNGLDVTFGTYFTDYIIGVVCFVFGVTMFVCAYNLGAESGQERRKMSNDEECDARCSLSGTMNEYLMNVRRYDYTLCLAFLSCSFMYSFGGVVHQTVKNVKPTCPFKNGTRQPIGEDGNNTVIDLLELTRQPLLRYYITWQVGSLFAIAFALFLGLLVPYTITREASKRDLLCHKAEAERGEGMSQKVAKIVGKGNRIMLAALLAFFLLLVIYHAWKVVVFAIGGDSNTRPSCNSTENGTLCGYQIIQEKGTILDEKFYQIWETEVAILLMAASFVSFAISQTCFLIQKFRANGCRSSKPANEKRSRGDTDSECSADPFDVSRDALLPQSSANSSLSSLPSENGENISKRTVEHCCPLEKSIKASSSRHQFRFPFIHALRCLSAWALLASGMTQCLLAPRCEMNASHCPLPKWFNHNGLYHVMLIVSLALWYISELLDLRQEAKLISQKALVLNNNPK